MQDCHSCAAGSNPARRVLAALVKLGLRYSSGTGEVGVQIPEAAFERLQWMRRNDIKYSLPPEVVAQSGQSSCLQSNACRKFESCQPHLADATSYCKFVLPLSGRSASCRHSSIARARLL